MGLHRSRALRLGPGPRWSTCRYASPKLHSATCSKTPHCQAPSHCQALRRTPSQPEAWALAGTGTQCGRPRPRLSCQSRRDGLARRVLSPRLTLALQLISSHGATGWSGSVRGTVLSQSLSLGSSDDEYSLH
eukprot:2508531-Rhodomonas_salina.1